MNYNVYETSQARANNMKLFCKCILQNTNENNAYEKLC